MYEKGSLNQFFYNVFLCVIVNVSCAMCSLYILLLLFSIHDEKPKTKNQKKKKAFIYHYKMLLLTCF